MAGQIIYLENIMRIRGHAEEYLCFAPNAWEHETEAWTGSSLITRWDNVNDALQTFYGAF